jgi:hypothetical protein
MQSFQGTLTDPGGSSVDVAGSIDTSAAPHGDFEFADSDAIMQSFMEQKTFVLKTSDGKKLQIQLDSVTVSDRSGYSHAEFSSS